MSSVMSWLNEPPQWSDEAGVIRVRTGLKTDFWRRTFYGYITDNGHFYHRPVTGDFTAEVVVSAGHSTLDGRRRGDVLLAGAGRPRGHLPRLPGRRADLPGRPGVAASAAG